MEISANKPLNAGKHPGLDRQEFKPFFPIEAFLFGKTINQRVRADPGRNVEIHLIQGGRAVTERSKDETGEEEGERCGFTAMPGVDRHFKLTNTSG